MTAVTTDPGDVHLLVPFWGEVSLLEETVRSALAQDDPRWLLTVVDDAAPQGEAARALTEGLDDDRVDYVRNAGNLGITRNFQRCLALARTPWAAFPGCDDLLLPAYVGVVRRALTAHPDVDMVQPGVRVIDAAGREASSTVDRVKARLRARQPVGTPLGGDRLAASLLGGNWLYFPAMAFRVDAARRHGFDPRWEVVEDLALVCEVLRDGGRMVLLDQEVFAYRRHAASVSSTAAASGRRFTEERAFFAEEAVAARALGWRSSERAARFRWSSRLHALGLVPAARSMTQVRGLLGHAAGPG